MRRMRSKLTYANVVATLALFLALGGGAYAVATIDSGDVIDDSLKSVDLKNDKAVKSADVRDDTLTGGGLESQDIAVGAITSSEVLNQGLFADDLGRPGTLAFNFPEIPAQSCDVTTLSAPTPDPRFVIANVDTVNATPDAQFGDSGGLVVSGYPVGGNTGDVNLRVCNITGGAINPGATQFITLGIF